jgi:hypothetical protein
MAKRSINPSCIIALAPAPPSSALGGLEDHGDLAGEVARLGEIARGAEQHGRVTVMAAGMHHAGIFRRIGNAGRFHDR